MKEIKFGTDGWRAIIADGYTIENLVRVTEATATWLKKHHSKPSVMIGYDTRFNGELFCRTAANVLAQNGVLVFIPGNFVSTPMVSLALHKRQVHAGVVITASHNPAEYSGYKLKGSHGGPSLPDDIAEVEALIPDQAGHYEDHFEALTKSRKIQYFDMEAVYLNHLRDSFDLELIRKSGLRIGYDAMFGAGQSAFRKAFPTATLLHCDYNPSFQGVAPEPIEKNLSEFQALIPRAALDIGIATDGDADRIGLFDEEGNFVDSHHIILLLIYYLVKERNQQGKVIVTFSVTPKVKKLCGILGLPIEITKVGFKYICDIMLRENVLLGGEESGGIAIAGHVPERDGIFIGTTILEMMAKSGKKLTRLIQEMYDLVGPFSFQRRDLHLSEEKKKKIVLQCQSAAWKAFGNLDILSMEDLDGFKFFLPDEQWVMIRPSGTEPVLRIYAESASREGAERILDATIDTILERVPG